MRGEPSPGFRSPDRAGSILGFDATSIGRTGWRRAADSGTEDLIDRCRNGCRRRGDSAGLIAIRAPSATNPASALAASPATSRWCQTQRRIVPMFPGRRARIGSSRSQRPRSSASSRQSP